MNPAVRTGLVLFVAGVIAAGGLAWLRETTAPRIDAAAKAFEMRVLDEVMPPDRHDNDLMEDVVVVRNEQFLGGDDERAIYRARMGDAVTGVVIETVAPNGYGGEIKLLVGVDTAGELTGVRVTKHSETPGLGDKIDTRVSDWILGFNGRSLANTPESAWAVRKQGGEFDQFTGATITPAVVVTAVQNALLYFDAFRAELLELPPDD